MFNPPDPGKLIVDQMGDRSGTALAKHLGVTCAALSWVINGNAGVSAEMALRLQDAFGVKADLWLTMQAARGLWSRRRRRGSRFPV